MEVPAKPHRADEQKYALNGICFPQAAGINNKIGVSTPDRLPACKPLKNMPSR
jgi:hypothetical protein